MWLGLAVVAALINIVLAELCGWLPWLAESLVRRAARRLPDDVRLRYEQEWLAELDVLPVRGFSSIVFAVRVSLNARRVRRELLEAVHAQWWQDGTLLAIMRPGTDFLLLYAALAIALGGVHEMAVINRVRAPLLLLPPTVTLLTCARGLYRAHLRTPLGGGFVVIVAAVSVATMIVAQIALVLNGQLPAVQAWTRAWLFSTIALVLCRVLLVVGQRWARKHGLMRRPVLIIGAGVVGAQIARRLETHPEYGLAPVGFLDDDPRSVVEVGGRPVPVIGSVEELDVAVASTGIKNLIVAFSSVADARVSRLVQRCQELDIDVSVVPRMFDTINSRIHYDIVAGLPILSFDTVDPKGAQFAVKHALDRILAIVLLLVFSPVMLLAAIAVHLSSPGPVLFTQRRVGRDGTAFNFYKFRSMRQSTPRPPEGAFGNLASREVGDSAPGGIEGEDRRTAVGSFLRRRSIDELPQLFNVLRGEMSIVGPRPERPEFVERFRQDVHRYGDRHRVKSGITGWAQVRGLRGQTSLAERVEWDNYYIAHWSLGLDLKILVMTVAALVHDAE